MKMNMKKTDAGNENQNEKKKNEKKQYFQLFQSLASRASHNTRTFEYRYTIDMYDLRIHEIQMTSFAPINSLVEIIHNQSRGNPL